MNIKLSNRRGVWIGCYNMTSLLCVLSCVFTWYLGGVTPLCSAEHAIDQDEFNLYNLKTTEQESPSTFAHKAAERNLKASNDRSRLIDSDVDIFSLQLKAGRVERKTKVVSKPVSFYAMGDAPYGRSDRENLLPLQIGNFTRRDARFMVHLGDMKGSEPQCQRFHYKEVFDHLTKGKIPTYIVPGDNDWAQCFDPQTGFQLWSEYFMHFDQNWNKNYAVNYQEARPEHFSFFQRRVLFLGVHVLAARAFDDMTRPAWDNLLEDSLLWIKDELNRYKKKPRAIVIFGHAFPSRSKHLSLNEGISELAEADGRPFLYLQGNNHKFAADRPFQAKNILRIVVDMGGKADPLFVQVDVNKIDPFEYTRRALSKGL